MELGTKRCFVTSSHTYLDLYTTSIYKQTYVTSDTGIQNVMTSTSLKIKISRLNNAIEYKWLSVQTTKKLVKLQPLPRWSLSLCLLSFFLKYPINLPLFSHRDFTNFFQFLSEKKCQMTKFNNWMLRFHEKFLEYNTELIYPCFRTVRSSIFYFLKRVLKNVTN